MYIILISRYDEAVTGRNAKRPLIVPKVTGEGILTPIFLVFAIVMFVTEKIPLGLTSMIVCKGRDQVH